MMSHDFPREAMIVVNPCSSLLITIT